MEGYIAEIRMFAGNFAPRNWAFCQGQILAIAPNTALFSLIGTIYGGDGQTTFALPDLRGRGPIHPGQGPGLPNYALGQLGGAASTTLLATQMPVHNHSASSVVTAHAAPGEGDSSVPTNRVWAKSGMGDPDYATYSPASAQPMHPNAVSVATTIGNAGGGQPFNNMQPYLAINYIICLYGIYPSRD